jgi:L-ribulose-5-phosphate 3-epimerase
MGWRRLAQNARQAGFAGIDLTVRKGGHVLPEKAAEDLPSAVSSIREEGVEVPMITTELVSAADPTARAILSTAGKLSIPF